MILLPPNRRRRPGPPSRGGESPLRVAHFNTFDTGGAAIAAARLHRALLGAGQQSSLHFLQGRGGVAGEGSRPTKLQQALGVLRPHLERLPVDWLAPRRSGKFSVGWLPNGVLRDFDRADRADVLHLHWLGDGFVDVGGLRRVRKPVVWTLHDMWAFTGGCFYDAECGRFANGCGQCPIIHSEKKADLSSRTVHRKLAAWDEVPITVVTPSHWLAGEARRSQVFRETRIEVIPNCVDLTVFKPIERALARSLFNLPPDRRLILFGAVTPSDPRKGYTLLEQALTHLSQGRHAAGTDIVIFGGGARKSWRQAGFQWHSLGSLHDEVALSLAYNAADVFVAPSLQDNLPNTVLESLACGTPGVSFAIGGLSDMIEHRANGYLARPQTAADLAQGIEWVLDDALNAGRLRGRARASVEERFSPASVAARHLQLYHELTGRT